MKTQLKEVSHDYIRYANCWEDADILLDGLQTNEQSRVLSIGSAGDNSFSFLAQNPAIVVAVDINPIQLKLIELKKAAISILNRTDYLEFYGFSKSKKRAFLFAQIKLELEKSGKKDISKYWEKREKEVLEGLVHSGKFEKYFHIFSKKVLPLIHSTIRIDMLFQEKSKKEQKKFYKEVWNSKRWQGLFKIFFGKFIMGRLGRSKAFLDEVEVSVGKFIFKKAKQHLKSTACQKNYFLHYILKGNFGAELPHYVREGVYEKIKKNIDKLEVFEGFAEDAFAKHGKFNRFNLSDIFEYMTAETFKEVAKNFEENAMPNSRFAYWNLMVPRKLSEIASCDFKFQQVLSKALSKKDLGFFYGQFIVEVKP